MIPLRVNFNIILQQIIRFSWPQDSLISMVTRLKIEVRFLAGAEIVSFPEVPDRLWGPYQLPPPSAKGKIAWSCTSTQPCV
jgi:hypothetical protein